MLCPGLAAYARSKDHDDRQCVNEGVALVAVIDLSFPRLIFSLFHFISSQFCFIFILNFMQGRDEAGELFFSNQKAGGTQLYRPLGKDNAKETDELIVVTIKRIEEEAKNLDKTVITLNDKTISFKHTLVYTMLDGKGR